jgi:hypothetical protein
VQRSLYTDPALLRTIEAIVGLAVVPSGAGGTFTYYGRPT